MAYLLLENGQVFEGQRFGHDADAIGEVTFSTSMTGYVETLTDPCYQGQLLVQTFPLIGNYGVTSADFESDHAGPTAYIVKEWCQDPSNFRSEGDLDTFLKSRKISGLHGIDTRELTKAIRRNGTMKGVIIDNKDNVVDFRKHSAKDMIKEVSTKEKYTITPESVKYKIALLDLGVKNSTLDLYIDRGCEVTVFPYDTPPAEFLATNPDGIVLSDGPSDPAEHKELIANIKELIEAKIPIFARGLGHQLVALAHGFRMSKLKHGHYGNNIPVKNLDTGKVYITKQNHTYYVDNHNIAPYVAEPLYVNINDGTVEGIRYLNKRIFSVQFYPEPSMFDDFLARLGV